MFAISSLFNIVVLIYVEHADGSYSSRIAAAPVRPGVGVGVAAAAASRQGRRNGGCTLAY